MSNVFEANIDKDPMQFQQENIPVGCIPTAEVGYTLPPLPGIHYPQIPYPLDTLPFLLDTPPPGYPTPLDTLPSPERTWYHWYPTPQIPYPPDTLPLRYVTPHTLPTWIPYPLDTLTSCPPPRIPYHPNDTPLKGPGTRDTVPPPWTDRHLWQRYLPTTSFPVNNTETL